MGVTGLWQILQPCARPIKIETLNRKRLAVDASIWIYQFLKAVRDKEGNALRNSHVVGFFRRICKLLFFGIKPVFVFDGGAPALKRQTINARKRRREGRRDDAVRTAGKLLAVQMQRRAEEDEQKRKDGHGHTVPDEEEETVPDEGLVYVDELQMSQQERQQNRKFRKKDAYHLPDLDVSMNEMGQPNDPRVMSLEDLEAYARQFESGEDINVYDFSKIDYDSPFFTSLPASDRYNILNAARLRSRLRMGHSKEQLDSMFPDRMAFSKFQIDRVTERNELTTRLMNINDGDAAFAVGMNGSSRVAGEKAREYVLVKNEGVEGGWALGVIGEEGTKQETAIDIDRPTTVAKAESEDDEDEVFEDVPIEGLNRLPKRRKLDTEGEDALGEQRRALYRSRRQGAKRKPKRAAAQAEDPNSLFVADQPVEEAEEDEWEEVDPDGDLFGDTGAQSEEEDEELRRAIAMSLQSGQEPSSQPADAERTDQVDGDDENDMLDIFQQRAAEEARPVPKGSARSIANLLNRRAHDVAPDSHEVTSFGVPVPRPDDDADADDDSMDLQAALAESRRGKRKVSPPARRQVQAQKAAPKPATGAVKPAGGFGGPLPFEKLDLGSSLLGKKKMAKRTEEAAGGFEHPAALESQRKGGEPLPPWFSGNIEEDLARQRGIEREDRERAREFDEQFRFQSREAPALRRWKTGEVVDLEGEEEDGGGGDADVGNGNGNGEVIDLEMVDFPAELSGKPVDHEIRMGDLADVMRAEPPTPPLADQRKAENAGKERQAPFMVEESGEEEEELGEDTLEEARKPAVQEAILKTGTEATQKRRPAPFLVEESDDDDQLFAWGQQAAPETATPKDDLGRASEKKHEEEENLEWSESEGEGAAPVKTRADLPIVMPAGGEHVPMQASRSPSMEFEDVADKSTAAPTPRETVQSPSPADFENVGIPDGPRRSREQSLPPGLPDDDDIETGPAPASGLAAQHSVPEVDDEYGEFAGFSDSEEEELLKALTLEAEEHARFASTLNNSNNNQQPTNMVQNIADYEKELKQLRNQQKKDRRDADEVTHIMITECQQLLRLFGLPYVTAPMEAEAQCAELVKLGLVDGIVTDDSDCFLFGGTRVYKNMFNQAKFVECYLASDLEKEFALTRDKMIAVAQLLGSDYTEGLPGVGPVTALEVLSEFGDLGEFRDWWTGVQMNTITKEDDKARPFRKKFRRNATKLFLPPGFPDPRVDVAYQEPEVDHDPQAFQWGVPDLDALRSFLMATIGWSQERTDEVLVPVIRDMNRRMDEGTQSNITAFFDGGVGIGAAGVSRRGEAFAPRKRVAGSKRMGTALGKLAERARVQRGDTVPEAANEGGPADGSGEGDRDATVSTGNAAVGSKKRKTRKAPAPAPVAAAAGSADEDGSEFEEEPQKKGRKKAVPGKPTRSRRKRAVEDDD
ncbi:hypothetical protein LTR36_002791 [Oleoguttula mirabilis]|uniref:PIN domain-like protein n=1 Tax=Oleoguttula mirabilis TaxID=1507867 RepID=A0AAV9JJG5_9PEZI|nr:hypothetical protein LTR36_002791 [Oleoguttula mirabilis]